MRAAAFVRSLLRHRFAVLGATLAISMVAVYFAKDVSFDNRIEIWFLENDPDLLVYRDFLARFEADELAIIGVFAPDVFVPDVLALIDRVTQSAERVTHAHRVRSLTNVRVAESREDVLAFGRLIRELPKKDRDVASIRERALAHPLIRDTLVAPDARAAAIWVELEEEGNSFEGKQQMVRELNEILTREARPGIEFRLTGTPALDTAFFDHGQRDWKVLGVAAIALVFVTSFLTFRRFSAAIVPLSVVFVALLWLYGLMGALDVHVNMISVTIMALVLAVGVQDSVHVLSDYYQQLGLGKAPREAIETSVSRLLQPCFFTSFTTAAGFLSLTVSDLRPIREFGWLAATGVFFAFILSITFVPAVLHLARPPDQRFVERQTSGRIARMLRWLGRPTKRRSAAVLAGSAGLLVLSVLLLQRLQVGVNPMGYFRETARIRQDTEAVDGALAGSTSVQFMVRTAPDGLKEPDVLERIEAFQIWIEEQPAITQALSVVDSLKELQRIMVNGDASAAVVPESRAQVAQLYLLLESEEDFAAMVTDGYSLARITAQVKLSESETLTKRVPFIEEQIAKVFSGDTIHFQATGFVKLMGDMETYLLRSQIRGFLIAFVVITVTMMLLLRSVRLGLYSLIPNLVPVLAGLSFMAAFDIRLDPGTVMIGSMALGLVVDDSVHYLVRLRSRLEQGDGLSDAIANAMRETGRAILVTSILLAAGFSILGLGSFAPNAHFGLVSAFIVILAVIADLLVLPAMLLVVHPRLSRA